jgi:hypothetical protein
MAAKINSIYIPDLPTDDAAEDDIPTVRRFEMVNDPGTFDRILTQHFEDGTARSVRVHSEALFSLGVLLAGGRRLEAP